MCEANKSGGAGRNGAANGRLRLAAAVGLGTAILAAAGHAARGDFYWQGGNGSYNTSNWTFVDYTQQTDTSPATVLTNQPAPQFMAGSNNSGNAYNVINGGQYTVAPNTNPGAVVPTVTPGGVITIGPADPAWGTFDLRAGDAAGTSGTYVQTGSTVTVNSWLRLGTAAGATGTYNMSGGTLNAANRVYVGESGTGRFNLTGGTVIDTAGEGQQSLIAGGQPGGTGTANISGTGVFNAGNEVWIGQGGGSGTLNINNGGTLTAGTWVAIGRGGVGTDANGNVTSPSVGVLNVGPGGTLNLTTTSNLAFILADGGGQKPAAVQATLNMTGGLIDSPTGTVDQWWIAQGSGGQAVANVSGGTININSWIAVGRNGGHGVLNLSGTAVINKTDAGSGTAVSIGGVDGDNGAITNGVINQTGGTFNNTGTDTWIGENVIGAWNVSGGTANLQTVYVAKGNSATSTGVLNISGTGVMNATGGVIVAAGQAATATMTVGGGGVLNTTQLSRGSAPGTASVALATGGVVRATAANALFISGFKAGEFNVNGGTIDTGTFATGISSPLAGTGGFTKVGSGVLTVMSNANTYTGQTTIAAGTLRLAPATTSTVSIPAAAVQAYYAFEDPNNLLNDSSGNGNSLTQGETASGVQNGSITGSTLAPPTANGSVHTGSANFAGQGFLVPANNQFPTGVPTGNSAYTIAAWINVTGRPVPGGNNGYGVTGWGNFGNNNTVNALRTAGASNVSGGVSGIDNYWWGNDLTGNVTGAPLAGNWHYIAATFDPSVGINGLRTIYEDGVVVAQDSPGTAHNAAATNFAVGVTNNTEYFDGNMADLLIANAALSPGQLAIASTNNLNGTATQTTSAGLLPSGTTVNVSSGAVFDLNSNLQTLGGLIGATGSSVTLGSGTLTVNATTNTQFDGVISGTGGLTVNGSGGTLTLGGTNTFTGPTVVNGRLAFAANAGTVPAIRTVVGTLAIGSGGVVALPIASVAGTRTLLVAAGGLGIAQPTANAAGGTLDLGNGDVDVPNGSLTQLTAAITSGYAGGRFNAAGIISSAALANARHTTTVGVILNTTTGVAGGSQLYPKFDGQTVAGTDVLVKYTYYGDANLDGSVTGADYTRIDAGYSSRNSTAPLAGWYNGDFNYDGKVDGSDYTLIDNAFNLQQGSLAPNAVASPLVAIATSEIAGGSSAVPEPAAISLLSSMAAGLLFKRQRAKAVR